MLLQHCTSWHVASFIKKWGAESVKKSWQAERKKRKKLPIIIMQILIRWGGVVYRFFNFPSNVLLFSSTFYMLSKKWGGGGMIIHFFICTCLLREKRWGTPPAPSSDKCPKYHLSFKTISIVFVTFYVQPVLGEGDSKKKIKVDL